MEVLVITVTLMNECRDRCRFMTTCDIIFWRETQVVIDFYLFQMLHVTTFTTSTRGLKKYNLMHLVSTWLVLKEILHGQI